MSLSEKFHFLSEKDLAIDDGFGCLRTKFKREKPLSSVTNTVSFGLFVVLSICMV